MMVYRLWQGEEAAVEGTGRQGDRATSHRAGAVEDIKARNNTNGAESAGRANKQLWSGQKFLG